MTVRSGRCRRRDVNAPADRVSVTARGVVRAAWWLVCLAVALSMVAAPALADVVAPPVTKTPSPSSSPSASPVVPDTGGAGVTTWVAGVGGGVAMAAAGAWLGLRRTATRRAGEAEVADQAREVPGSTGDEPDPMGDQP